MTDWDWVMRNPTPLSSSARQDAAPTTKTGHHVIHPHTNTNTNTSTNTNANTNTNTNTNTNASTKTGLHVIRPNTNTNIDPNINTNSLRSVQCPANQMPTYCVSSSAVTAWRTNNERHTGTQIGIPAALSSASCGNVTNHTRRHEQGGTPGVLALPVC